MSLARLTALHASPATERAGVPMRKGRRDTIGLDRDPSCRAREPTAAAPDYWTAILAFLRHSGPCRRALFRSISREH